MRRENTWAPLDDVESTDLNAWQDVTSGVRGADSNGFTVSMVGEDGLNYQGTVADGVLALIDSHDWRDRKIGGHFRRLSAATVVGGVSDYQQNDASAGLAVSTFEGRYLGTGGISNLTTGALVSNGNPPLIGKGANTSYAVVVDDLGASGNVLVYCSPSDGHLYLYNASGASVAFELFVRMSGETGLR